MKMLKSTLLACLMLITYVANAQEKCGMLQAQNALFAKYPALEKQEEEYKASLSSALSKMDFSKLEKNTRGQYIIPMVFHILHTHTYTAQENVLDQQVYDEMVYINENFNRLNTAALNTLVWSWKDSAANCGFEFRLARKDPNGNCTNGINRIFSAKTNEGNNTSKLEQWPNQFYFNVWVCNAIRGDRNVGGTLAFALKPASVVGSNGAFFYDGVIMKNSWLGRTGTYQGNDHYTVTHEIAHSLGLDHVWGGTNQPGVNCGDDGVNDTPKTEGHFSCGIPDLWDTICKGTQDPTPQYIGILHNTQNFMEYSGCGAMFTKGQKAAMKFNLDDYYYRGSLIDSFTHAVTGVLNPVATCAPIAEFYSAKRFICQGTPTTITDYSYNGGSTTRNWTISNATLSSNTVVTPTVTFNTVGWQAAKLDATNIAGTNALNEANYFYAADPVAQSVAGVGAGKLIASFEVAQEYAKWPTFNYFNNNFKWQHEPSNGHFGGQSMRYQVIDKRNYPQSTTGTSDRDYDDMFTEAYDLTTLASPMNLNFWIAGASSVASPIVWDPEAGANGANVSIVNDSMAIHYSNDCGATWKYMKGYKALDLHNNGYVATDFLPTLPSQWAPITLPITTTIASNAKVFFRFRYYPSNGGNNFYIDDISISNYATGVNPVVKGNTMFAVYPNPSNGKNIAVTMSENISKNNFITITDITGKILLKATTESVVSNSGNIQLNTPLSSGIYLVSVVSNGKSITSQKLTVQ